MPIVEPEVLMDGNHTIERCEEVTEGTLNAVFDSLYNQRVVLEHMVLKPTMVISGADCAKQAGVQEVAERTLQGAQAHGARRGARHRVPLGRPVRRTRDRPPERDEQARRRPWPLTFSYGRALQQPSLKAWKGLPANVKAAQAALGHRSRMNGLAATGQYSAKAEAEFGKAA